MTDFNVTELPKDKKEGGPALDREIGLATLRFLDRASIQGSEAGALEVCKREIIKLSGLQTNV